MIRLKLYKTIYLLVMVLMTSFALPQYGIEIFYHLEAELIEGSSEHPHSIAGVNHIRVMNSGDKPIDKIYIRNNSNIFFKSAISSSPKTVVSGIAGDLIAKQPVWTQAVMRVDLSSPLMPGEKTDVHVQFETVISTGSGQYFPTAGVFNDTVVYVLESFYPKLEYLYPEGWREAEYRNQNKEHYPAADYLVELTVPDGMVIASSGVMLSNTDKRGKNVLKYASHNMREFIFVASKSFKKETIRVPGMAVSVLMPEGQLKSFKPMKDPIRNVLTYYSKQFGQSNSPELTITTAFSLGTDMASHPNLFVLSPEYLKNEKAIVHELAHQWFGNKGAFEMPDDEWFIEAVAEYAASGYYSSRRSGGLLSKKPDLDYTLNDLKENIVERSFVEWVQLAYEISGDNNLPPFYEGEKKKWEQVVDRYSVYAIGSYTLQMLKETIGRQKMNAILNEFAGDVESAPMSTSRFLSLVEQHTDQKVSRQFALALTTAAKGDIYIDNVVSEKRPGGNFLNRIIIDCKGEWLIPASVRIQMESGRDTVFSSLRYAVRDTLILETSTRIKKIEVDPENKMYDANRYNNRWPRTFAPQPLTEIPSWKVYSLYFRPRAFSGWDGGQRLGVRYSGRVGINLMPYQSALYQHSFDLDVLFATSRATDNWAWNINYRTPVKSTDLMFWRFSAGNDHPRNTQELSFIIYIGEPEYWAVNGRSTYKHLTTNISRIEFIDSDSTSWWRKSQSWALKEQFVWFNYTGARRQILRSSIMSGIYVYSGEKYRISKFSASYDYEKHHDFGLIARAHIDGGLSYGAYPNNSYKFRIRQVSRGWKNRENYIPLFRGRARGDEDWQSSVLSAGASFGIETNWYVWPMVYSDMVITSGDVSHSDIEKQVKEMLKADPLYIAAGFGVESQSIIELGIYFPVWISHPELGQSNFGMRFHVQAGFYF